MPLLIQNKVKHLIRRSAAFPIQIWPRNCFLEWTAWYQDASREGLLGLREIFKVKANKTTKWMRNFWGFDLPLIKNSTYEAGHDNTSLTKHCHNKLAFVQKLGGKKGSGSNKVECWVVRLCSKVAGAPPPHQGLYTEKRKVRKVKHMFHSCSVPDQVL